MVWCGFNDQMAEGLTGLGTGLVEHGIIDRSKKKSQSHGQTIQKELDDMERFAKEIHRIKDPELREVTESITRYASAFYKLIDKKGVGNYKNTILALNKFFWEMDNKYYTELEGQQDDMKKLAEYLNTLSV